MILLIGLLAICFLLYFLSEDLKTKRKLKNAQIKSIKDFKNGEVARIVGEIEYLDKPLIAPLSGRECVYYRVIVTESTGSSENRRSKKIIKDEKKGKLAIRDGNFIAFINTSKAKEYIVNDCRHRSCTFKDATPKLESFLKKHNEKSEFMFLNRDLIYEEAIIEKGEKIVAWGKGTWKSYDCPKEWKTSNKVLIIDNPENDVVCVSDEPELTR